MVHGGPNDRANLECLVPEGAEVNSRLRGIDWIYNHPNRAQLESLVSFILLRLPSLEGLSIVVHRSSPSGENGKDIVGILSNLRSHKNLTNIDFYYLNGTNDRDDTHAKALVQSLQEQLGERFSVERAMGWR